MCPPRGVWGTRLFEGRLIFQEVMIAIGPRWKTAAGFFVQDGRLQQVVSCKMGDCLMKEVAVRMNLPGPHTLSETQRSSWTTLADISLPCHDLGVITNHTETMV